MTRSQQPTARTGSTPGATTSSRPALALDPWLYVALASLVLLVARSLGSPVGEPVADDFDHLRHALFVRDGSWFGGGGSVSFWRPLAYQAYYGALHEVVLQHPAWIFVLHAACFAVVVVLLFDLARRRMDAPAAAVVASFPVLLESGRALLIVPVHFVDLGLVLFSVIAWRLADGRRFVASLAALLAALFCKETAIATAVMLPFLARVEPGDSRRRWFVGAYAVAAAWAVAYALVRANLALVMPHGLEAQLTPALLLEGGRYAWAAAGTLRALVSLPMLAGPGEPWVAAAALLVSALAIAIFATNAAARARLAAARGGIVTGFTWSVLASATLLSVYPVWSPERVVYASLGLGLALTLALASAHRSLPFALLAVRVAAFVLAPGASAHVTNAAPESGAFVDYVRLARLQNVLHEARIEMLRQYPVLPHGGRIAVIHPPHMTAYAAGDHAIQVWYRDSTLRWVRWDQLTVGGIPHLSGALEFDESASPQFRRVDPAVLKWLFVGEVLGRDGRHALALQAADRADSLMLDREAHHVLGRILGMKAWSLAHLDAPARAESLARASLAFSPINPDGRMALATLYDERREWAASLAQLDSVLLEFPDYAMALRMRSAVLARLEPAPGGVAPGRPSAILGR